MAKMVKQPHGGAIKLLEKGETANPNGRPKKIGTILKEQGYALSQVNDTIQAMMAMDLEELKSVWDNPKATILEKTIANAMKKSMEKGSLYSMETLLSRVYGKPSETIKGDKDNPLNVDGKMEIKITREVVTRGANE